MMDNKNIALIGAALGWGAQKVQTELGPEIIKSSQGINELINSNKHVHWQATVHSEILSYDTNPPIITSDLTYEQRLDLITNTTAKLAKETIKALKANAFPIILGGDHSIAIGTWSGVTVGLNAQKSFGLIWFDAHMDSHTTKTSPSMAIHGMPVAVLLGQGEPCLVNLQQAGQKIDPKHVVLIGVRSYEEQEVKLLEALGVTIFYMKDIAKRGFEALCKEALKIVTNGTQGFGLSIDLDGFDPHDAPGVGSRAAGGVNSKEALSGLSLLMKDIRCKALEIAEFNPLLDQDNKTLQLIETIIRQKIK